MEVDIITKEDDETYADFVYKINAAIGDYTIERVDIMVDTASTPHALIAMISY